MKGSELLSRTFNKVSKMTPNASASILMKKFSDEHRLIHQSQKFPNRGLAPRIGKADWICFLHLVHLTRWLAYVFDQRNVCEAFLTPAIKLAPVKARRAKTWFTIS